MLCLYIKYIYLYINHINMEIYIIIYTYTHIYMQTKLLFWMWLIVCHTHTHTFIRYTLLVLGWTPFCLHNCQLRGIDSTKCWKHSSEILDWKNMMWISRSTTSQRCSIGLRSGDCGGHLSKVNSLSCSRNQSEMIWALWHGALSCWKYSSEDGYTVVIKGWTWSATILR